MPVTHGVTGSSPVRTASLRCKSSKVLKYNTLGFFFVYGGHGKKLELRIDENNRIISSIIGISRVIYCQLKKITAFLSVKMHFYSDIFTIIGKKTRTFVREFE